ncbi:MAG: rod shape-determining protein MreD [Selenomonadaceae bacterium]|nr:rod shape-determining protein MreD [Selenomonadaceae bacterium]
MKTFAKWAILVLTLYILQTSLLPLISYNGVSPNLMLLLTVSVAFLLGHRYGVFMGFAAGLLQDLTAGSYFGCVTFSYMLIGLLCGKFSDKIFKDQFILPVISSFFTSTMHYLIMVMFIVLLGYQLNLQWSLQYTFIPLLFWQFVFSYPIHKLVFEFDKHVSVKR